MEKFSWHRTNASFRPLGTRNKNEWGDASSVFPWGFDWEISPIGSCMNTRFLVSGTVWGGYIMGNRFQEGLASSHFGLVTDASFLCLKVWSHSCLLVPQCVQGAAVPHFQDRLLFSRTLSPNKLFFVQDVIFWQKKSSNWYRSWYQRAVFWYENSGHAVLGRNLENSETLD